MIKCLNQDMLFQWVAVLMAVATIIIVILLCADVIGLYLSISMCQVAPRQQRRFFMGFCSFNAKSVELEQLLGKLWVLHLVQLCLLRVVVL